MAIGNKRKAANTLAKFPIDFPTGVLQDFAGTSAPDGWLLCDGSEVSRTEYAALFAVIGTTYGVGDGSTTFNLPDERGMFRRGLDNMGTAAGAAGVDVDGTARTVGQLQSDANKAHTHRMQEGTIGSGTATRLTITNVGDVSFYSSGARNLQMDAEGETDTRPMNHAYYVIIKA